MKIGRVLDWQSEVYQFWKEASPPGYLPAEDLIAEFPDGICWIAARFEPGDLDKTHVIAAKDWQDLFGSFRLVDIARKIPETGDDDLNHFSRIRDLTQIAEKGEPFYPPILVARSGQGPFVIIDGNHRAIGLYRAGRLRGHQAILGLLPIGSDNYRRYSVAIELSRTHTASKED